MQWTLKKDKGAEVSEKLPITLNTFTLNHEVDRVWHQELLQVVQV